MIDELIVPAEDFFGYYVLFVDSKAKLSPNNNMKIDDVHEEA
jgi:hypothetical protein